MVAFEKVEFQLYKILMANCAFFIMLALYEHIFFCENKDVFLYAYLRALILILRVLLLSIKLLFSNVICHKSLLTDDTEQIIIQKFGVDTV